MSLGSWPRKALLSFGVVFVYLAAAAAAAQDANPAAQERYLRAFEAMRADLADPERSMEFAEAAVAAGDVRGAIAALERVLLLRPDLANIKAQLGYLYLQAGAPETAQTYLEEARASGQVPPQYEAQIAGLSESAERARRRHLFSGNLFLAGRWESNANAGPLDRDLEIAAGPIVLDKEDKGKADYSFLTSAGVDHIWDFRTQRGDALKTSFAALSQRYLEVSEANVGFVDIESGPRFVVGPAEQSFGIRPFLGVSWLWLEDTYYRGTYGGGIDVDARFGPSVLSAVRFQAQRRNYDDSKENPGSSDKTGMLYGLFPRVGIQIAPDTYVQLRGVFDRATADESFEAFYEIGGDVALTQYFDDPFGFFPRLWAARASIGYVYSPFDDPDPVISDQPRTDKRLDVGGALIVPVAEQFDQITEVFYTHNASNYETDQFDNVGVSFGVSYRF